MFSQALQGAHTAFTENAEGIPGGGKFPSIASLLGVFNQESILNFGRGFSLFQHHTMFFP